jgi:hypothetical protein
LAKLYTIETYCGGGIDRREEWQVVAYGDSKEWVRKWAAQYRRDDRGSLYRVSTVKAEGDVGCMIRDRSSCVDEIVGDMRGRRIFAGTYCIEVIWCSYDRARGIG